MTDEQLSYIKTRLTEIVDEKVNYKKHELFENGDVSLPDITSEDIFNAIITKEATLKNKSTSGHLVRTDLNWPTRTAFEIDHKSRLQQLRDFKERVIHERRHVMDQIMLTGLPPLPLIDEFANKTVY